MTRMDRIARSSWRPAWATHVGERQLLWIDLDNRSADDLAGGRSRRGPGTPAWSSAWRTSRPRADLTQYADHLHLVLEAMEPPRDPERDGRTPVRRAARCRGGPRLGRHRARRAARRPRASRRSDRGRDALRGDGRRRTDGRHRRRGHRRLLQPRRRHRARDRRARRARPPAPAAQRHPGPHRRVAPPDRDDPPDPRSAPRSRSPRWPARRWSSTRSWAGRGPA